MNLWIRSQDGTILIKVDNLLIDDDNFHIYTHNHINNMQMTYTLGRYKTKERALEVLDEIQKIFYNNQKYINDVVVYQMPIEQEDRKWKNMLYTKEIIC